MTRLIDADALLIKIDEANYTAIDIKNLIEEAQTVEQDSEPVGWIYEDELPSSYPYDAMFPFSKVDMVRMFPVYLPKSPKREWRGLSNDLLLSILCDVWHRNISADEAFEKILQELNT